MNKVYMFLIAIYGLYMFISSFYTLKGKNKELKKTQIIFGKTFGILGGGIFIYFIVGFVLNIKGLI